MPVRATSAGSAQIFRFERRAARQQEQAERRQQRLERRETRKNTPSPSLTPTPTPAPTTDAATVQISSEAAKTEAPKNELKNFIGNTAGAKVVNFAVQGGRDGNRIAVFASGEGPKAVKPEEKPQDTTTETKSASVDTEA